MGDVGDGDEHDPAAGVLRVGVGLGVDGVVMVARISRIDGDQRHVAQIRAALRVGGWQRLASAITPSGKSSGMPCACMAIRLILR